MNGLECHSCGTRLEASDQFCGGCGQPVGVMTTAAAMPPPFPAPPPVYGGPMYYKPPRNPRQTAAIAAGVMVIICGMFALFVGSILVFDDAWGRDWDPVTDEEYRVLDPLPFAVGVVYMVATGLSLVGAYFSFRTSRFIIALTGPISLLVAYFGSMLYEPTIMLLMVHVMIMSIICLGLLSYAMPGFGIPSGPANPFTQLGSGPQWGGQP